MRPGPSGLSRTLANSVARTAPFSIGMSYFWPVRLSMTVKVSAAMVSPSPGGQHPRLSAQVKRPPLLLAACAHVTSEQVRGLVLLLLALGATFPRGVRAVQLDELDLAPRWRLR